MTITTRFYAFEILIAVSLIVITFVAPQQVLGTLGTSLLGALPVSIGCTLIGITIRLIIAKRKGEFDALLAVFRSRQWLFDSLRIVMGFAFLTHTYAWIKLLVPHLHQRLYDRQLFALDSALFGGHSPDVFLLTLFSDPRFLRFIDFTYAGFFGAGLIVSMTYFLSDPSPRLRLAFMTSNTLLWLSGAWLYVLVPSLGPAYRFPQVWLAYAAQLKTTQGIQGLLMHNYQNVLRLLSGASVPVHVMFGIGAFPSLHVANQVLVALWMRKEWVYGQLVFGILAFFIFIGSMITGWHYFVDGLAGAALAFMFYEVSVRAYGLNAAAPAAA